MTQKHETIQTALTVAFFVALFVSFVYVASFGINKAERVECEKLRQQAEDFPLIFFSTDWQRQQCEYHGLPLPK